MSDAKDPSWVRTTLLVLIAVEVLIVILDVVVNYGALVEDEKVQDMFNVAREMSVGNWFSSTQSAVVALVLWLIHRAAALRDDLKGAARGWAALSGFFMYLAIDDGTRFHENVAGAIKDFIVISGEREEAPTGMLAPLGRLLEAFPSYPWLILFGPVFAAVGVYMLWFLWRHLDRRAVRRVALGLGLYVVAESLDFIEGLDGFYDRVTESFGLHPYTAPHFGKVTEEFLEALGTTILLWVFLGVAARLYAMRPAPSPPEATP